MGGCAMPTSLIEVFISYSRKNKDFVKTLADAFEQVEKTVWIDWEGIPHGSEWWAEIEAGIENSNNFIFVISPDSLTSKVCAEELAHAVKHNKRLIPILYQEVGHTEILPALAKIDWIFFREVDDFKHAFVELLKTIDTDLESVKIHTRLTRRAIEWQQNKYDASYLLRGNDLRSAQQWLTHINPKSPKPTSLQTQYIVKSAQTESKNQRFQLITAAVGLFIAVVLGIVAHYQWLVADEQENIAKQERNLSILNNIEAFAHLSSAQLATDNRLDALLSATKSARLLISKSDWFATNGKLRKHFLNLHEIVPKVLREAIYGAQELNRLEWHDDKVQTLVFTPDGKKLVSGSSDTTVKIWQRDGKLLHTLYHKSSVYGVSVSHDSRLIVSAGRDHTIKLWDIDGNFLSEFEIPGVKIRDVNISRDGQFIAAACDDSIVRVWKISGEELWLLRGHEGAVQTVKFSPDSKMVASGGNDRVVKLWNINTGKLLSTLEGHHDRILTVDFHPNKPILISGSADNTVKFWHFYDMQALLRPYNSLLAHKNWIYDVEFSADGDMFATASANGTIKLWSADGTLLEEFDKPGVRMTDVSFSNDGELLSSAGGDNTIRIYALKALVAVKRLEGHTSGLKDLDYSPGGKIIASTATDGTIRLWNAYDYRLIATIKTKGNVRDVDFALTDKGYMLMAASYNNSVQFWLLGGSYKQPEKILNQHEGRLLSIAVHPNNKIFATTHSNKIQLWTMDGQKIKLLEGHTEGINTLVYSHDGKYLASGGADDIVIIWDEQGNRLHTLKGHYSWINNISFSPDNNLIATASSDKTIGLWRTSDGELVDMLKGHEDWVWDVNFYPDPKDTLLVSGGADNTVRVWDYQQNKLLITLKGHKGWVRAVSFSPNGKEIASGGADQRLIIWETESVRKRFSTDMHIQMTESLQVSCRLLKDYLTNNNKLSDIEKKVCQGLEKLQTLPLALDKLHVK